MATLAFPQMIKEMQAAIQEELKATKQKAYKHIATNGKMLSDQPGSHTYVFTLSELWEPQDDAPIKIKFNGSQDIKGTLVNSTGTTITIATDKALPPEALDKITLEDDPSELLERLYDALETNQEGPTSLGSKSFGLIEPKNARRAVSTTFGAKFQPDESQRHALRQAMGSEVTLIVGPPGTGKTSTLAAIAFAYLQEGRSLLIAAHTNIAIDNAIMRLADICRDTGRVTELNAGRIVRYGVPQLRERIQSEYSEIYLPEIIKRRSGTLRSQHEQVQSQIDQLVEQLRLIEERKKPWLEKRRLLLEQLKTCKQELHNSEEREQQHLKQLNDQINDLLAQQVSTRQEIEFCQRNIAQYVAQQTQWQTKRSQLQSQEKNLQLQLAEAQQAGVIKRLSKRLNPQKLALQLGEIKYQIDQCRSPIGQIEVTLSQNWHPRRARAEVRLAQISAQIQSIKVQQQQPSSDAARISQLRATKTRYEQKIEEVNTSMAALQSSNNTQQPTSRLEQLREQRASIDKQLADMERNIVAEAQVVATTLCKTYMNKNLCERRFDVVIIDEVSMAPLPAVYIAASRADNAVIAIGDPQQLAPIYSAQGAEMAKKWLGRDLFELNNITLKDAASGSHNSVLLEQQSRMHPQISQVARKHVYKNFIADSERVKEARQDYAQIKPLPEKRLVLCDTSDYPSIAIRTSNNSHQNAYHALCSFQLACQVLATLPKSTRSDNEEFRVGIVTPYRGQADLLRNMIKDAGLHKLIRAGTVHRFQGLEAEAIIFDTTDSLPLQPPFRLTSGGEGTAAMRLVNVAITRAQQKLLIVADQEYIKKFFCPDDTLYLAVLEAAQSSVVRSADVLKEAIPLLPKLAHEPNIDIQGPLDDRSFYNYFIQDLKEAKKQIIMFSPFLGRARINEILSDLEKQIKRGLQIDAVYSVPRKPEEKEKYTAIVRQLQKTQVHVHYRTEMHEKFVFVDNDVVYIGSLNVLSHDGTTDYMYRLRSLSIAAKLKKDWQVETVLARPEKEGKLIEIHAIDLTVKN